MSNATINHSTQMSNNTTQTTHTDTQFSDFKNYEMFKLSQEIDNLKIERDMLQEKIIYYENQLNLYKKR